MQMKTIDEKQLKTIIENHKHWLNKDCADWENMRADLYGADLCGADLCDSNLSGADLSYADIRYAHISDVDLHNALLSGSNLSDANLYGADLHGATLYDADLRCTNLYGANLCGANLSGANLYGADLHDANINNADLCGTHNVSYISMICPEEGTFIGWKKAITADKSVIVKLNIFASAKRSSATSRICRCNKAKVLEIYNLDGTVAEERKCYSIFDKNFIYEVGKIVKVNDFDDNRWNECSQGIHFFINRQEAINYIG